ncbi:MAG: lysophospholipase L1-like esterase [Bacteroidia bacterium]
MSRRLLHIGCASLFVLLTVSFHHQKQAVRLSFSSASQVVDEREDTLYQPQNLSKFYDVLDLLVELKRDKVVITHIGDSHIQADYQTHTSRVLFQKTFGNGGRGFVFPYRLIRSNSPTNLSTSTGGLWQSCRSIISHNDCNFGLAGTTATTFDSTAFFRINPNRLGDMNYEFNKVKLFSYQSPLCFDLTMLDGDSLALDIDIQPINSTVSDIYFNRNQDSLWLAFKKLQGQDYFQFYGLSFENQNPGIIYNGIGQNGAFVKTYLRHQFFNEQLSMLNSDLVILSLGTNDGYVSSSKFCKACFKSNYRTLLNQIISKNPSVSILLVTPNDIYIKRRYHNDNMELISEAIYELSDEFGTAVWDFYHLMGGSNSMTKWRSAGFAQNDLVHFTEKGYTLQGQLLYQAIMNGYERRFD